MNIVFVHDWLITIAIAERVLIVRENEMKSIRGSNVKLIKAISCIDRIDLKSILHWMYNRGNS